MLHFLHILLANYRMDFGKLLPPDNYFAENRKFVYSGSFAFDRFGRNGSARELKPIMDYTFTVDIQEVYWRQQGKQMEPQMKQQQLHEESLEMQSVGTTAVILEVPNDRAHDKGVEWSRNAEMQSASANGSVGSLNVGAELSASDERDSASESARDSDAHATLHSSQGRRKKFTRLLADNSENYDEEDQGEDHPYTPKVVTRKLPTRLEPKEEQRPDDIIDSDVDVGSDSEICGLYDNDSNDKKRDDWLAERIHETKKDKQKHNTSSTCGFEKQSSVRGEKMSRDSKDGGQQRNILDLQHIDEKATRFLQEEMQLKDHMTKRNGKKLSATNIDEDEVDDQIIDDSWAELEKENKKNSSKQLSGEGSARQCLKQNLEDKPIDKAEPKTASKLRKPQAQVTHVEDGDLCTNYEASTLPKLIEHSNKNKINHSTDDSLVIKPKVIRKKKIVSKTEELEVFETSTSKPRTARIKYVASQENLDVAPDSGSHFARDKLGKKPKNIIIDMDAPTETDELEDCVHKPKVSRNKPMPNAEEERISSETVFKMKKSKSKRSSVSKTDLLLGARWVEVSKEQTEALKETEQFIETSCKAELDEISIEEQCLVNSKKSTSKKLVRSSRTILKNNIECNDVSISSEECSNIRPDQDIILTKMNSKIETSAESSVVEQPKLERKGIQKEIVCSNSQNLLFNPQKNQAKPNSSRTRERTSQKLENVSSALLDLSPTKKHEKKHRQSAQKSLLQEYLDAEESCAVEQPQEVSVQSVKSLKCHNVKATGDEPAEPGESGDLESINRKRLAKKKRTIKLSSAVQRLEQSVIGKVCAIKEKTSGKANLEGTVHMYDETKGTEEPAKDSLKFVNQSVNTDISNMDESIKQIMAAGRKLQHEIQRKSQEYIDSLSQCRSDADISEQAPHNQEQNITHTGADYDSKFVELEQHIVVLEQHVRKFESRTQDMQDMNSKLEQEKVQLKQRITHMEYQISQLCQQSANGNDLQQILSEMRQQNIRYMDMSKAKDRYKKQWRRTAKRVHALKLAMYEKRVQNEKNIPK